MGRKKFPEPQHFDTMPKFPDKDRPFDPKGFIPLELDGEGNSLNELSLSLPPGDYFTYTREKGAMDALLRGHVSAENIFELGLSKFIPERGLRRSSRGDLVAKGNTRIYNLAYLMGSLDEPADAYEQFIQDFNYVNATGRRPEVGYWARRILNGDWSNDKNVLMTVWRGGHKFQNVPYEIAKLFWDNLPPVKLDSRIRGSTFGEVEGDWISAFPYFLSRRDSVRIDVLHKRHWKDVGDFYPNADYGIYCIDVELDSLLRFSPLTINGIQAVGLHEGAVVLQHTMRLIVEELVPRNLAKIRKVHWGKILPLSDIRPYKDTYSEAVSLRNLGGVSADFFKLVGTALWGLLLNVYYSSKTQTSRGGFWCNPVVAATVVDEMLVENFMMKLRSSFGATGEKVDTLVGPPGTWYVDPQFSMKQRGKLLHINGSTIIGEDNPLFDILVNHPKSTLSMKGQRRLSVTSVCIYHASSQQDLLGRLRSSRREVSMNNGGRTFPEEVFRMGLGEALQGLYEGQLVTAEEARMEVSSMDGPFGSAIPDILEAFIGDGDF